MENIRRMRVIVATSEKLVVWLADGKDLDQGKTSVECPHCGEDAIVFQLERNAPAIEIVGDEADSDR